MRIDRPIWLPSRKLWTPNFPPGFGFSAPSTGLTPAAAAIAAATQSGTILNSFAPGYSPPPNRTYGWYSVNAIGTAFQTMGDVNMVPAALNGTLTAIDDATGAWRRSTGTVAAGVGFQANLNWTTAAFKPRDFPFTEFLFRTGPAILDYRLWFGWMGASGILDNNNALTFTQGATVLDGFGVVFSSADAGYTGTGGFFQAFTSVELGATVLTANPITAWTMAVSTIYRIRVEGLSATQGQITINGSTPFVVNYPAFAHAAGWAPVAIWQSHVNTRLVDVAAGYISRQTIPALPLQ